MNMNFKNNFTKIVSMLGIIVILALISIRAADKPVVQKVMFFKNPSELIKGTSTWISAGYKIQLVIPQSVSTSMDKYYVSSHRDLYGGFVVVLEKK